MHIRMALDPGGGGVLSSFLIRRLGPSIYRSPPKNIRSFKHPKKYLKFSNPKKYPPFCTLTLRKDPNMQRNELSIYSNFVMTPKISTKCSYPKKCSFFWKPPKILFWTKKNGPSLGMHENIRVLPPPPPWALEIRTLYILSDNCSKNHVVMVSKWKRKRFTKVGTYIHSVICHDMVFSNILEWCYLVKWLISLFHTLLRKRPSDA